MDKIRKQIHNTIEKSNEDRVLRFVGSTEDIDRDGEVIKASGWNMEHYKKNPVILFGHNYNLPAVAKAQQVFIKDNKLIFDVKFPSEGISKLSDELYGLYKEGIMSSTSVGFMPTEWKDGDGTKESPRRIFTKQDLLELSLVPVPSNPEANIESRAISKALKDTDSKEDKLSDQEVEEIIKQLKSLRGDEQEKEVETVKTKSIDEYIQEIKDHIDSIPNDLKEIKEYIDLSIESLKDELIDEIKSLSNPIKHILDVDSDIPSGQKISTEQELELALKQMIQEKKGVIQSE